MMKQRKCVHNEKISPGNELEGERRSFNMLFRLATQENQISEAISLRVYLYEDGFDCSKTSDW